VAEVPSVPFALLSAALQALADEAEDAEEEEEEEEEAEAAAAAAAAQADSDGQTLLLLNQLRHPDAPLLIASLLSGGDGGETATAAGGAARLLHLQACVRAQEAGCAAADGVVFAAPLDIRAAAPPFGGALLAGAAPPPRLVSRQLWKAAQLGKCGKGAGRWRAPAAQRREPAHSASPAFLAAAVSGAEGGLYIPDDGDSGFWPHGFDFTAARARLPPSLLAAAAPAHAGGPAEVAEACAAPSAGEERKDEDDDDLAALMALVYGRGG